MIQHFRGLHVQPTQLRTDFSPILHRLKVHLLTCLCPLWSSLSQPHNYNDTHDNTVQKLLQTKTPLHVCYDFYFHQQKHLYEVNCWHSFNISGFGNGLCKGLIPIHCKVVLKKLKQSSEVKGGNLRFSETVARPQPKLWSNTITESCIYLISKPTGLFHFWLLPVQVIPHKTNEQCRVLQNKVCLGFGKVNVSSSEEEEEE